MLNYVTLESRVSLWIHLPERSLEHHTIWR